MKTILKTLLLAGSAMFSYSISYSQNALKKQQPNIILILADDLGWSDISAYGNTYIRTPSIDALATGGVKFTHGYATAPICGPSRAALITGRYQQRFGSEFQIHENIKDPYSVKPAPGGHVYEYIPANFDSVTRQGLPVSEVTLAQQLKKAGYKTAIIGKWHLGRHPEFFPERRGFDHHFGFLGGGTYYYTDSTDTSVVNQTTFAAETKFKWANRRGDNAIRENGKSVEVKEYLTDRLADEAVNYIEKNREQPFFVYIAFNAPHTPVQAPRYYYDQLEHIGDPRKRAYYAMILSLDAAVGKITGKVENLGLADNTLIFFVGDNGGASYTDLTDNAPLKGGKITEFEGGLRVPFIAKWTKTIEAGKTIDAPVSLLDIFPTASDVAGQPLLSDRKYDGVNLIPYIKGVKHEPHKNLFWRHGYQKAVISSDWKLLVDDSLKTVHLYNKINNEFDEHSNLAASNPEKVKELKHLLSTWESELPAPRWKSWRIGKVQVNKNEVYYMPL
ncbi:MAG: sulfatase [Niabella sp.]